VRLPVFAVVAVLCLGLLAYSQIAAYYADEGFELVAAQLVLAGKTPYLDFFYQHTPLYAYLAAAWMRLLGNGWRSVHLLSTLATAGAIFLAVEFVRTRFPEPRWRTTAAVAVALLISLQPIVLQFGTISQAYGICLLLTVAAFRLTVAAAEQGRPVLLCGAGFCTAAAAGASLISIPVAPVLFVWLLRRRPAGSRTAAGAWFLAGALIPLLPVAWTAARAPSQMFFDVVTYHRLFRQRGFDRLQNVDVLGGWLNSAPGVLLALLGLLGLLYARGRSGWQGAWRHELTLCAWLAAALLVSSAAVQPSWEQYLILAIPFAAVLASVGVCAIGASDLTAPRQRIWLVALATAPFFFYPFQVARWLFHGNRTPWIELQDVVRQIHLVTPENGLVWASEVEYAAASLIPPSGLENHFAFRVSAPAAQAESLHIVTKQQVDDWLRQGRFDTACNCQGPERIASLDLAHVYTEQITIGPCVVFWNRAARDRAISDTQKVFLPSTRP
jgi:4-amino-4-deoxy-L-arabinose transferase-like glycosyltransferase